MNVLTSSMQTLTWEQKAYQYLVEGAYKAAAALYEQAIESETTVRSHYWNLGLLSLLQGEETDAQAIWGLVMADAEIDEIESWTAELTSILQAEAVRRTKLQDYSTAWLIRQHIREICPTQLENLLCLILLAKELGTIDIDDLNAWDILSVFRLHPPDSIDPGLLLYTLNYIFDALSPTEIVLEFTEACLTQIRDFDALKNVIIPASLKAAHSMNCPTFAARLLELTLSSNPDDVDLLGYLAAFAQHAGNFEKGIEAAQKKYELSTEYAEKLFASHVLLRSLMSASGRWKEASHVLQSHRQLLSSLTVEHLSTVDTGYTVRLFNSAYYLPYFSDQPQKTRPLQNQVAQICQANIQQHADTQAQKYQLRHNTPKVHVNPTHLKIGYLSYCMCRHSVGWLARGLIQHHDRDRFKLHGYFINRKHDDPVQDWYLSKMDQPRCIELGQGIDHRTIAENIYEDNIDILIDLDSVTLDMSCAVMALKPAPVQVTWLGWDSSGIPAIDYYIADPYVLPDDAQDYYAEKIWRLPQTYIAVDGFETEIPTLRREHLEIPADAVVFLSAQRGHKRHPETTKLQMQILKEVPNSYFLIKGISDRSTLTSFFTQLAEEVGVSTDRLRFLPEADSEAEHRANLTIADVVLDTFPYNGATTTLETLWMGIPLVTRVGQQFAARNSYTMMVNAGIREGIAWTDEEYVEWGVRLGKDAALRQKVHCNLMRSRRTAPLWNAKQFARDMEDAYSQMWQRYLESHAPT